MPKNLREIMLELKAEAIKSLPPNATLADKERAVLAVGRRLQAAMMEELLLDEVAEPEESALPCPDCGESAPRIQKKKKRQK